jgi:hypothetical protein
MSLLQILTEGRKEDFVARFSKKFNEAQLQQIINVSESLPGQNKYLNFIGNVVNPNNFDTDMSKLESLLERFSTIGPNLPIKDINQYKTIEQLKNVIDEYNNKIRREIKSDEQSDLVYEDDDMVVIQPKTYEASCKYGAGTKWCTTATKSHFDNHNKNGKLFYFIDKKKPTSDPLYKVALYYTFDDNMKFYNATDDVIKSGWIFGSKKLKNILDRVVVYIQTNFGEEYERIREEDRIRREQEARKMRRRMAEQQERREENLWQLPTDDEEALKANALFQFLVNEYNIDYITDEEKQRLRILKQELERLQEIYDETENANENTDLISDIEVTEDEINELEGKIDVYYLIPEEYRYYGLKMFDYNGETWAVGTEDEFDEAAHESAESLIDELGLESFNPSFTNEHINKNKVRDYIKDFFTDVIYEDPSSYLNDEDRELSKSQIIEINELQKEKNTLQVNIKMLEQEKTQLDVEKDTFEVNYDEMNNNITEMEDRISEIEDEIESITSDPEGDFSDEKIEEEIESQGDYYAGDGKHFYENYLGGDNFTKWLIDNNLIDIESLIEDYISSDGHGHVLDSYDGDYYREVIENVNYFIIRTN